MHRNIPTLLRVPVFTLLLVYSLIVLGIDAHFVDEERKAWADFGSYLFGYLLPPTFDDLGVATSVLTLISIVPMLIIEFLRQGAVTSWVIIELAWLGFLCVMWLATAADTANYGSCTNSSPACSQFQTVEAFSFLAWLLLGGYWMVLLVCTIVAFSNGQTRIWITAVTDADFAARGGGGIPQGGVPQGSVPQGSFPQGNFPQGGGVPAQPAQQVMTFPVTGRPASYPPV